MNDRTTGIGADTQINTAEYQPIPDTGIGLSVF